MKGRAARNAGRLTSNIRPLTFIILLAALLAGGCAPRRPAAQGQPVAECLKELHRIPLLAAVLKAEDNPSRGESRPLEGMQIALTIGGMIRSQGDAEEEIDSFCASENTRENFERLLDALRQHRMPPTVAFVDGRDIDAALLAEWVAAGNLVGNQTFSGKNLRKRPAVEVVEDIRRNETLLAPLWDGGAKKYFRYPRLRLSRDADDRQQVADYLQENGYTVVPATIDARNRQFGEVYCAALDRGDQTCASLVKEHFKKFLLDSTMRARAIARRRMSGELKQILVLQANQFLCDNLAEILAWYKGLGVRFVTIDEALAEPVYATVDERGRPASRFIIKETKRRQLMSAQRKSSEN